MKKATSLLLALILCLSLCACGSGNNVPETTETPTITEPQYTTVEITIDNWQDYFEIVSIDDWHLNGFGESEGYSNYYKLKLRDEYKEKVKCDALGYIHNVILTVEFTYTWSFNYAEVDFKEMWYSVGKVSGDQIEEKTEVWDVNGLNNDCCTYNSLLSEIEVFDFGTKLFFFSTKLFFTH